MSENNRNESAALPRSWDEVNADSLDLTFEVVELVECGFLFSPVVLVLPVGYELSQVVEVGANSPSQIPSLERTIAFEPSVRASPRA